jgi:U4/U6 small nuclear ribonucleoprotein PRP4
MRLWDLRSGKSIYATAAHVKAIHCCDFSPNCWELATGSADHTVKIWDLRKQVCSYTIPAHAGLISDLR